MIILLLLLLITLIVADQCSIEPYARRDCGVIGSTQDSCEAAGCCWDPLSSDSTEPWCFYKAPSSTYDLVELTETEIGYEGKLHLSHFNKDSYGESIQSLKMELLLESADYVRLKITDANNQRWEVPQEYVNRPQIKTKPEKNALNYHVKFTHSPFSLVVIRKEDNEIVLETSSNLIYKDQYLQVTTLYKKEYNTYGIGESTRTNHKLKTENTYTLFAIGKLYHTYTNTLILILLLLNMMILILIIIKLY